MNQLLLNKITVYSQQNGFRQVNKRVTVAMALSQFTEGVDGDSLWLFLRNERFQISRGTVYLALKWLIKSGIANRKVRDDRVCIFSIRPL
ncbi:MAG: Fur family transcriptional regulator [Cytophagaceae bacterium]|nr:MAG: Fur family transcriptional regulator [Cytophagaceae bacterium]